MPGFSESLGDRMIQSGYGVIQLLGAAAERGHEHDGVEDGAGE